MSTVKAQAQSVIQKLPDDCTFEDVQYELYVLEKIRKSEASVERDGTVSHDEAKQRMGRWLSA
jgi:hypothetical protein